MAVDVVSLRSPIFIALAKFDAERDALRARVAELEIENADLQIRNDGLTGENAELRSQLQDLSRPGHGWGQ